MNAPTVVLIGLRACGKTTAGRAAAASLGVRFTDLDEAVAARGKFESAARALTGLGIQGFREAERDALEWALCEGRTHGGVIALGGGTPTHAPSAALLRGAPGLVRVYLRATAGELQRRLAATDLSSRPSLTGNGVIEEVPALLAQRDPLYLAIADCIVDVDGQSVQATATQIAETVLRRPRAL